MSNYRVPDAVQRSSRCSAEPGPMGCFKRMDPGSAAHRWRAAPHPGHADWSVRRETVQQAGAAGADQILLAAAALRSARGMSRIPGIGRRRRGDTGAVGMSEHRRALRAARPILAGAVLAGRESGAVGLRSRQYVMAVRVIADAVVDFALLGQPGLLGEIVVAMQLGDILRDHDAL